MSPATEAKTWAVFAGGEGWDSQLVHGTHEDLRATVAALCWFPDEPSDREEVAAWFENEENWREGDSVFRVDFEIGYVQAVEICTTLPISPREHQIAEILTQVMGNMETALDVIEELPQEGGPEAIAAEQIEAGIEHALAALELLTPAGEEVPHA